MALHQSGEDYLEAILVLQQNTGAVRSVDVAQYLGYSKPSVSRAVSVLRADGHIVMESDGQLKLTEQGEQIAAEMYQRHRFLTQWLESIGVTPAVAAEDACRMEHYISGETFACLQQHAGKIKE